MIMIISFCNIFTPGIYAEGYIVFVFRSFVTSFVIPSCSWNYFKVLPLQFLKRDISHQPLIRKHSYLDHRYPEGSAFIP